MNESSNKRLFLGCFLGLVSTAFAFIIRSFIISDWKEQFEFTNTQVGSLNGIGLAPFAISIVLFSLIIDKVGYGKIMVFAFCCQTLSIVLTIMADDYASFYFATFIVALGNGAVEAVINPVVATIYDKNKTHMLNILHAGWPGGLVLGGLLTIWMGGELFQDLPGSLWQWKVGLLLIPTVAYGILLVGVKFPVNERVSAGVPFIEMLREFGSVSCLVIMCMFVFGCSEALGVWGIQLATWQSWAIILGVTIPFHLIVRSFGHPIFVLMMLIMIPLACTELGTDGWISDLMTHILKLSNPDSTVQYGAWVLVYTSTIMFVLRFFAGPIVHRISPVGLLCVCSVIAAIGLIWLSAAQTLGIVFLAATFYGIGKTFFWPTTLGVIAERFPKGGALTLNAISGLGMLSVGVLGLPLIGYVQDTQVASRIEASSNQQLAKEYLAEKKWAFFTYQSLDKEKFSLLEEKAGSKDQETATQAKETIQTIKEIQVASKRAALARIAILPCIMFLCYLFLLFYFKSKGGYKAEVLVGHSAEDEEFTGGVPGPVE